MDLRPPQIPSAGKGPQCPFPATVPGSPANRLCRGQTAMVRRSGSVTRPRGFRPLPGATENHEMGGLCQGPTSRYSAAQFVTHAADRAGDDGARPGRYDGMVGAVAARCRNRGEEPELPGDGGRSLVGSQPPALRLFRADQPRRGQKPRRRAALGVHDLAILHRHARSGKAQPREHGLRHRLRARQDQHDD